MSPEAVVLEVVRDRSAFAALRNEWDGVLERSRQDGPFLRHDWLTAWLDDLAASADLHALVTRDGQGQMTGACPLYTTTHGHFPPVRTARLIADRGVGSTGLGAFALPDFEDAVFAHLAAELRSGDWDTADLRFLDPDHGFLDRVLVGGRAHVEECGVCPCIDLPPTWDEYLATLTKHMRHEVRRSIRRVAEKGFEPELIAEATDVSLAAEEFMRLHESRMRTKFGDDYTVPQEVRRFTTRTMADLMRDGRLRMHFMRLDGERVAGLYFFRYGDTVYAEQSGFDETRARQDVLRALWATAIRSAIEEGCSALDMLLGEQHYKLDWQPTRMRKLYSARVYSSSLTGAARRGRDWVAAHVR